MSENTQKEVNPQEETPIQEEVQKEEVQKEEKKGILKKGNKDKAKIEKLEKKQQSILIFHAMIKNFYPEQQKKVVFVKK